MYDDHKIREFEYLHILFWIIKDTAWMMEWRTLGIIIMFPTIFIALWITVKTLKTAEVYVNLAIFFWIMANSYWMCCEFMGYLQFKNYAVIPFAFGLISTSIYYLKRMKKRFEKNTLI